MGTTIDLGPLGAVEFPDEWSEQDIYDYTKSDEFKTIAQNSGNAEYFGFPSTDMSYGEIIKSGLESGTLTSGSALITDLAATGALDSEYAASLISGLEQSKKEVPIPASYDEYMQQEGFWPTVGSFLSSPIEVGAYLSAEGLGTSLPAFGLAGAGAYAGSFAAGPFGTVGGAVAGMGIGSAIVESGATILEEMSRAGINITKADEVSKALQDDEFMAEASKKGLIKGGIVGAVDAATAGVAGRLLARAVGKSLATRVLATTGEIGIQVAGGMGGEALGSKAIGREVGWPELLAEGIGEGFTGVIEVGAGTIIHASRAAEENKGPIDIEFEGQVYRMEPGKMGKKGKPTPTKVGATINLRDDNLGEPAKYEDLDVTYLGRGSYEGKDAALIRLPNGMIGPVAFSDLSFETETAIKAETIPEVTTSEDLDQPAPEETATAKEEAAVVASTEHGELYGPDLADIPYAQAEEMGLVGPTQTYYDALPPYLRATEKKKNGWPLTDEEATLIGEREPTIEEIDNLSDNINWLGRGPKRVSAKQLAETMALYPGISEKDAKLLAKTNNRQIYNAEKENPNAPTLKEREERAAEVARDLEMKDRFGETYKEDAARLSTLARELSYRGQLNPRNLAEAEKGAGRPRPIKKDVETVAEITNKRAEYNALRERMGLPPITNWERVNPNEITRWRHTVLGDRITGPSNDPRYQKIVLGDKSVEQQKAHKFIMSLREGAVTNPLNPREFFIGDAAVQMHTTPHGSAYLSLLTSTKRGGGKRAMEHITEEADRQGISIELDPVPLPPRGEAGIKMTESKLKQWYKRFGFERGQYGEYIRYPVTISEEEKAALTTIENIRKDLRKHLDALGLYDTDLAIENVVEHENVQGEVIIVGGDYFNGLVRVSMGSDNKLVTLNHEAIHALRDLEAFTKEEWAVLNRQAERWIDEYEINKRYSEFSYRIKIEEAIAHKFGDWATGVNTKESSIVQTIFKKIAGILEAFKNLWDGYGFQTAEQVFAKIKTGEMGSRASFSEYFSNPNDLPIDKLKFNKEPRLSKAAKQEGKRVNKLMRDSELNPKDLTWHGGFINTMRHVAHQFPLFAPMMTAFEHMREKRMKIANDASLQLKELGDLQRMPEELLQFNKAAEISQMSPGSYRPDAQGRINFVAPPSAPLGADSTVKPGEIVVLEGTAAIAYMKVQKVMKEIVLKEMNDGYLMANSEVYPLLQELGIIAPDVEITEEWITNNVNWQQITNALKDVRGRLIGIESSFGGQKITKEMRKDPVVKDMLQQKKDLQRVENKLAPIAESLKDFNDFTKNDYLPLMRFGTHFLAVKGEKGETLHYEQMEFGFFVTEGAKSRKLNDRKRQLEQQYPDSEVVGGPNSKDRLRKHLKDVGLGMELAASFLHGKKADMWEGVKEDLDKAYKAKGFRAYFQPRANTPGYSTDFTRGVAQYIQAMAGAAAGVRYGKALNAAYADTQKGPHKLANYADKAYKYISSPHEEFQTWRKSMFMWYLGGNISSALLQTMSIAQFTGPYLTQFAGAPKVAFELARAFREASATLNLNPWGNHPHSDVWLDLTKMPKDVSEEALLAIENGIVKQMAVLEEAGISPVHSSLGVKAGVRRKMESVMKYAAIPFNTIETLSRLTAFIASIRLARDPSTNAKINKVLNQSHLWREENQFGETADPYQFANFVVNETFGMYGKTNRAPYMRGIGAPILQFQSYIHMMWELLARLFRSQGSEGKRALAYMMLMLMITGGLSSLPGADDAMDAYDFIKTKVTGIDPMVRTQMREMMHDTTNGNPFGTEMLMHGLFNALGYDVQQRISMGNLPGADIMRALIGTQGDAADVLGLPGAVIYDNVKNGTQLASEGRWKEAVAHAMPIAMRNVYQHQFVFPELGIRTASGQQTMTPDQYTNMTWLQRAGKQFGLTPTVISHAREKAYQQRQLGQNIQLAKDRYNEQYSDAMYRQIMALNKGDSRGAERAYRDMQNIMLQIVEHNSQATPENRIILNLTTLRDNAMMRMYPDLMNKLNVPKRAWQRGEQIRGLYE
jgi:hypothetical protein